MNKPKIASDWMCGCAGCHMSLLDMRDAVAAVLDECYGEIQGLENYILGSGFAG